MSLRSKVLTITGATFILLFIVVYFVSVNQILGSYEELEKEYVLRDLNRSLNAINKEILELDSICYDWAAWDDTYEFIANPNEEYIKSNLVDSTFTGLSLNFIVYVNKSGDIVYAKAFDLINGTEIPLPSELYNHILYLSNFTEIPPLGSLTKHGIIDLERPTIIASRPILTSNDEGPIRGALIMGRFLNTTQISKNLGLNISVLPYNDELKGIQPINGKIIGYAPLKDIYGKPVYILKLETIREIYPQGVETVRYYILTIIVIGVLFCVVTILLIDRFVLYRLSLITSVIKEIHQNPDKTVPVIGKNELASLSIEINKMLDRIKRYNELIKVLNRILRHDLLNNLTIVRVSLEMIEPKDESMERLIKNAIKTIDKSVKLIKDVRELEASESPITINLREVIENVIERYPIKFNVEGDCICQVTKAIYSVIDNIINNAIVHGKTDRVDIFIEDKGEFCEIRIADYGVGIPDEIKDQIFEEGFKYKSEGSGLGLYIVKKVLERYGGEVIVEDNKPSGTVFILRIKKIV
uniref:histidine kinase n=1 Tax=Geoglobus ahangari TaxID=113653 RepID=A0A7C4S5V9_9EURY